MFLLIAVAALLAVLPPTKVASPDLVVHEWGTFTTFAGPDGTPRIFQTTVGESLPKFVYSRALQSGNKDEHDLEKIKYSHPTLVRMETPVTYFYTDVPRNVDVDVRMPDGSLTEFYPPVSRMEPEYRGFSRETCSSGRLVWSGLSLIPPGSAGDVRLPTITADDHYGAAREVDAAFVRFEGIGGVHHERFLFYRGIGNFDPPVVVKSLGKDRFVVTNRQPEAAPAVFVLDVTSGRLRFEKYGRCEKELGARLPEEEGTVDSLAAAMEGALVDSGLYAKEAAAMVKTWRTSWFAEEGTRVLYILPQVVTDRIVPLSVKPAPGAQVRVFVGRAEVLTPESQGRIEALLAGVTNFNEAWQDPAIKRFGRFTTPVLERISLAPLQPEAGKVAKRMLGR